MRALLTSATLLLILPLSACVHVQQGQRGPVYKEGDQQACHLFVDTHNEFLTVAARVGKAGAQVGQEDAAAYQKALQASLGSVDAAYTEAKDPTLVKLLGEMSRRKEGILKNDPAGIRTYYEGAARVSDRCVALKASGPLIPVRPQKGSSS